MKEKYKLLVRRSSGAVLTVVGLLLCLNVLSLGPLLATVIYPQHFWYQLYPDSTESANPTLLTAGKAVTVSAKLVYYDATAGIELPPPTYWVVKVSVKKVSDDTVVKIIDFGTRDDVQGGVEIEGHYCSIALWEETWTVPTEVGVSYRFEWSAQIKDSSGNDYGTQTYTTYGKTADVEPDGVFKINGKDASQTSAFVVLSSQLSISFTPIKNPDKITAVKVESYKGGTLQSTVTLTKQADGSYTGTYTLPGYGTYEIKGIIEWTGGNPLRKMSLIVDWGDGDGGWLSVNQIAGLAAMAVGGFLVFKK